MAAPANGFSLYLFYSGSSFLISCFLVFNVVVDFSIIVIRAVHFI